MFRIVFRAEGLRWTGVCTAHQRVQPARCPRGQGRVAVRLGATGSNGLRKIGIDGGHTPKRPRLRPRCLRRSLRIFKGRLASRARVLTAVGPCKAIRRVGVDDFWKLADKPKALPRGRAVRPDVLAAIVIAGTRRCGFSVRRPPRPRDKITLPVVDLRRVANGQDDDRRDSVSSTRAAPLDDAAEGCAVRLRAVGRRADAGAATKRRRRASRLRSGTVKGRERCRRSRAKLVSGRTRRRRTQPQKRVAVGSSDHAARRRPMARAPSARCRWPRRTTPPAPRRSSRTRRRHRIA